MNTIVEYIHFRWKNTFSSKVFKETQTKIKNCLSSRTTTLAYENELKVFRNIAKLTTRKINVLDFGAGSKKMGQQRNIQTIYKNSRASLKFQRILHHFVKEFNCQSVLEMGTSLGFSTVYLSKANDLGKVTTVEACPETAREAENMFRQMKLDNVELVKSTFADYFEKNTNQKYDLVFVDGHHDGKALLNYMDTLLNRSVSGCVFILDDIRWSDSMFSAWKELLQKSEFECHFDLFRMGILVKG
jgi:predicted O-methyltransferase YrrM